MVDPMLTSMLALMPAPVMARLLLRMGFEPPPHEPPLPSARAAVAAVWRCGAGGGGGGGVPALPSVRFAPPRGNSQDLRMAVHIVRGRILLRQQGFLFSAPGGRGLGHALVDCTSCRRFLRCWQHRWGRDQSQ